MCSTFCIFNETLKTPSPVRIRRIRQHNRHTHTHTELYPQRSALYCVRTAYIYPKLFAKK